MIRNGQCEVIAAMAIGRPGVDSVVLVEALTIREGIIFVMEVGLRPVAMESNSLIVTNMLLP